MRTLILPCAGRSSRFPGMRPKYLLTYPDGKLMLEKAMEGFNLDVYDRIIITIVKEHDEQYEAALMLTQAIKNPKVEILILDTFTSSPSETIALTLQKMNVQTSFVVKDSDNKVSFNCMEESEFIVGIDVTKHSDVQRLGAKSFLVVNEQNIITDIIEKQIKSGEICVGVYGFDSPEVFLSAFEAVRQGNNQEVYLSHIVAYLIGTGVSTYKLCEAYQYEDWGTLEEWRLAQQKHATYVVDLDGVIFKNQGKYGHDTWYGLIEPLYDNVKLLKQKEIEGAELIFMSARSEDLRARTKQQLSNLGFLQYKLVLGCNHGPRILINDFAATNPYPTATAINVPRDGNLENYL